MFLKSIRLISIWFLLFFFIQCQNRNDDIRAELDEIRNILENIQSGENNNQPTSTTGRGRATASTSTTSSSSREGHPRSTTTSSGHHQTHTPEPTVSPHHADRHSNDSDAESDHGTRHAKPSESGFATEPLGSAILFVVALITTSFNLGACVFLLYKIYKVGKCVGFHMSLRVVMYSVVADMLVGLFFTISIIYSTLFHELIEGTSCMLIGYIINTLTAADMLLIAYTAVNTYLEVVRHKQILRGRRDWLLMVVCLGIPTVISTILAQYHAFGPETYWCLIDEETPAGVASSVGILVLHVLVSVVVIVAYFLLRAHQKHTPSTGNPHNSLLVPIPKHNLDELKKLDTNNQAYLSPPTPEGRSQFMKHSHRRSVMNLDYAQMKLSTHLLIHLVQYTPAAIHLLCVLLDIKMSWLFTMAIIFTNLSGVFQLINYLHHEKVKKKHFESSIKSYSDTQFKNDTELTVQSGSSPNPPPQVRFNGHTSGSQSDSPIHIRGNIETRRGSVLGMMKDKVKRVGSRDSSRGYSHIDNHSEGQQRHHADRHLTLDPNYSLTAPPHLRFSSQPIATIETNATGTSQETLTPQRFLTVPTRGNLPNQGKKSSEY